MELVIEHLDDVLPHIQAESGIIHATHQGYSVINYVFSVDDTFDTAIARECRGLKFAPDGRLIARPFHKFFNLGEKGSAHNEPWHLPHVVLDKLDGSMVHPAMVDGDLVFMTRMGMSSQAKQAYDRASSEVHDLSRVMLDAGFTPIFEYTAPDNRIVVAYEDPQLTLLAVRNTLTGAYLPHNELERLGHVHAVPVAGSHDRIKDITDFLTDARGREGIEGYVVAFEDGHRLKIKTDAYALRHKALAGLAFEKHLLAWVATDSVDDVVPLLSQEAAETVLDYRQQVIKSVLRWEAEINGFVEENAHLPRKDFALKAKANIDPRLQPLAFQALDGKPPRKGLMSILERAAVSDTKVEAIRPLFEMTWMPIHMSE